jgi:hypothetical protein
MEMAGKHSDHYFRRWQAKIVTTIIFFCKKRKVLRILRFGEKVDQKNILKISPPPSKDFFFFEKIEKFLEFSDLAGKLIRKTF